MTYQDYNSSPMADLITQPLTRSNLYRPSHKRWIVPYERSLESLHILFQAGLILSSPHELDELRVVSHKQCLLNSRYQLPFVITHPPSSFFLTPPTLLLFWIWQWLADLVSLRDKCHHCKSSAFPLMGTWTFSWPSSACKISHWVLLPIFSH